MFRSIDELANSLFNRARNNAYPRDPLALDLDNDGIETIGASDASAILFNHTGDNTANGSGWLKPDDGWLVLDRNGNGTIDDGSELFGVNTQKSPGVLATSGFDALSALDDNSDGVFNSSDAQFAHVRVWRDLNQDGVSQTNELASLSDLTITAINLAHDQERVDLGNGNARIGTGTFVRTDGSTGHAYNLALQDNPFYRRFSDSIPLTAQAKTLPDMMGSGTVRDMREAASLQTPEGQALAAKLDAYSKLTSRADQMAALDDLIQAWGKTSSMSTSIDLNHQETWVTTNTGNTTANGQTTSSGVTVIQGFANSDPVRYAQITALEQFNGQVLLADFVRQTGWSNDGSYTSWGLVLGGNQYGDLEQSYQCLRDSVYAALASQTRLKPYLDQIQLQISADGLTFDLTAMDNLLDSKHAADPLVATQDLIELFKYVPSIGELSKNWHGLDKLKQWVSTADAALVAALQPDFNIHTGIHSGAIGLSLTDKTDIVLSDDNPLYVSSGDDGDFIFSGAGNDQIDSGQGDDFVVANAGNDSLLGGTGNDSLDGGAGDDSAGGGEGNDTLAGGAGNDTLSGESGDDVYVFGKGDGQDRIYKNIRWISDPTINGQDIIRFRDNVVPAEVKVSNWQDSLRLTIVGTTDELLVHDYFAGEGMKNKPVAWIEFADGTIWQEADIKRLAIAGDETDQLLGGYASNDQINGLGGSDTISGGSGDDLLDGGDGDDVLYGSAGNDTLIGGIGRDALYGNTQSVMKFDRGFGIDTVYGGGHVVFDQGVLPADIVLVRKAAPLQYARNGENLNGVDMLEVSNADGSVLMCFGPVARGTGKYTDAFLSDIRFADGTVWDFATLQSKSSVLVGTSGYDYLEGANGNMKLCGMAGNDSLNGLDGNDTLDGGTGDDTLYGGNGQDTYVFGVGYGYDAINNSQLPGPPDIVQLNAEVSPSGVLIESSGQNLIVRLYKSGDYLTINGGQNSIQLAFSDGTVWDATTVTQKSSENKTLTGTLLADTLVGTGSNDLIIGNGGDDSIDGGGGGDDTLDGGLGNDTLYGRLGADRYRFGHGYGVDVTDSLTSADEILLNSDVAQSQVRLVKTRDNLLLVAFNDGDESVLKVGGGTPGKIQFADGSSWDGAAIQARQESLSDTSGADLLKGTSIGDVIWASAGNDTILGMGGNDNLVGGLGADSIDAGAGNDYAMGDDDNDTISGGAGDDSLGGNNGNDALFGGDGNDSLIGGRGNDSLVGGAGGNLYSMSAYDGVDIIDNRGADTQAGLSKLTFTSGVASNDIELDRSADDLILKNTRTGDQITVQGFFNGNVPGSGKIDVIDGFSDGISWDLNAILARVPRGTDGADSLDGSAGDDLIAAKAGDDTLNGLGGNDTLDGGSGVDRMLGGAGDDLYVVDDVLDQVIENADEGVDTVKTSVGYTLSPNVENLTFTGNQGVLTGNSLNNRIVGGAGWDTLDGGAGADTMEGGAGLNVYYIDNSGDTLIFGPNSYGDAAFTSIDYVMPDQLSDLTLIGNAQRATGNYLPNRMVANANLASTLVGGMGDDIYTVNALTTVVEVAGEGRDAVYVSGSYTLAADADIEDMLADSSASANPVQLTGNGIRNHLYGGIGNDTLDGGAGADSMYGDDGDDTYFVDNTGDYLEDISGTDTVRSSVNYTLSNALENLVLLGTQNLNGTGNGVANWLVGNSGANTLTGNAGNDTLDGGLGNDTLVGGTGNDTYIVDSLGDVVTEASSAGTDTIQTGLSYSIASLGNIERLTLTGSAATNATGNGLANLLTGNSGNNRLDGGTGNDTMLGGAGDDTYVFNVATDVAIENANEGIDTIETGITLSLAAINHVENLTLTGTSAVNATGNALDNVLKGNSANNKLTGGAGNDRLDGGTGNDTMLGGTGNDTYVVNVSTDVVTENANEGSDTVESSITYTIASLANLENITLTGSTAINATGNAAANALIGNSGVNVLTGGAGNDTLDGAAGNDSLVGGTGNDTYVLGRGYGADSVTENDSTAGNTDVASFMAGISTDQIWFRKVNTNDLEVSIIGTADKLTLKSWYLGNQYHLEQFKTADGKLLVDTDVQKLVDAMAAFAPPSAGQTTLPSNYQDVLNPVLAANWH